MQWLSVLHFRISFMVFWEQTKKYSKFLILYVCTVPAAHPGLRREFKEFTYVHLVTIVLRYCTYYFSFRSDLRRLSHGQDEAAS